MKVIFDKEKQRIPVKMWLDNVEDGAMIQIMNLVNLPFAFHHLAIMPDCHQGYGMPIGGVLATDKVVIPNAVGVDIGCGMCALKTSLKAEQLDKETIKRIFGGSKEYQGGIRSCVPVGFDHHSKKQDIRLMPKVKNLDDGTPGAEYDFDASDPLNRNKYPIISQEFESALKQIGTLGGGNHFIEIQKDTEGFVWVMIHSGSRNLGYKVANHYNDLAVSLNERWFSQVPKEWQLAFLPIESKEAKDYMREMQYCVDFALANRKLMTDRIKEIISGIFPDESCNDMINIAHNYAQWENHFGQNVIVHRKGATLARKGVIGIIPGSQGTKSYIVRGLGNKESFESCSHGAGRLMGRKEAERTLNLEEQIKLMDDKGIVHGIRGQQNLDEAPGAYKDIDEVMNNQKDLVEILVELSPMAVIKGD